MDSEVFRDRVRERDLDNFLVEELQASEPFRTWFLGRLAGKIRWPNDAEARLRKSPPRGDGRQTDVELGWFDASDTLRACVLIESKITADFQPGQAEAYGVEARRLRQTLGDAEACCVLVAPAGRLAALREASALLKDCPGYIVAGAKSLFVRIDTPALDPIGATFQVQRDKVAAGLRAVDGLARWFEAHKDDLARLLAAAEPQPLAKPLDLARLERAFDGAMRDLAVRSVRDFDYSPRLFMNMLDQRGGRATAHALLAGKPSDGFFALWEKGGLEVTVEALVVKEPWRSSTLFSADEIGVAERRLREFGYTG